jgi:hypothetical protein
LGNLLDTIEEADLKMTTTLMDQKIAFKARGGKLISTIEHTKKKLKYATDAKLNDGGAALSSAAMFPKSNHSPINQIKPLKRQRQAHRGNSDHIHWTKLKLCEFCNNGVQSKVLQCRCVCVNPDQCAELSKHQKSSKKCSIQQSNPDAPRFVICKNCSEHLQKPFGHLPGVVCTRLSS